MASEPQVSDKSKKPSNSGQTAGSDFIKNKLGKYRIEKKIGAGGMGAVFLAIDEELNRTVALKILPKEKAQNPTLVKRFKAEGQAAAVLRHENIVTVYEAGEADGYLYLALEYVEGTDIHNLVAKRGVLPVKRSIEIIRQLSRALQHAYEQNIVHRDIKPSNFLIKRDGTVKLTDMGLARSIDETTETGITRAGTTVGTVDYMAPEQARDSKAADIRSDIYSLGCSWYQMLTGDAPFNEGGLTNKLAAHATKAPPDPREKNSSVPEGIVAMIRKMMSKKPEDRYQTPLELLEDLDNANLTRGSISNNVLAALADADGEQQTVKKPVTKGKSSTELPPKMEAVPLLSEAKQINISAIKITGIMVVILSVVGLFWWLTQSLSSSFDMGTTASSGHSFFRHEGEEPDSSTSTTNGVSPGQQGNSPNSNLPTAPTQGSQTAGAPQGTVPPGVNPTVANLPTAPVVGQQPNGLPPLTNRKGEDQYLPDWSMTQAMMEQLPSAPQVSAIDPATGQPTNPGGTPPAHPSAGSGTAPVPVRPGVPNVAGGVNPPNNQGGLPGSGGKLPMAPPQQSSRPRPPADFTISTQVPRGVVPPRATQDQPNSPAGDGAATSPADSTAARTTDIDLSLQAILKGLPESGGTIELQGSGPFLLAPTSLSGKGRIVLRGGENTTPIVVFRPDQSGELTDDSLLRVMGSSLHLIGIHFLLIGDDFPEADSLAMIEVHGGDLTVHDCSLTLTGKRTGRTTVFMLSGTGDWGDRRPAGQSRIFLNRAWLRGNGLTGIEIHQPTTDLIVNNSLFALGSGAAFRLTPSNAPTVNESTTADTSSQTTVVNAANSVQGAAQGQRIIRVISSSLVCNPAWEIERGGAETIPSTKIMTANSIIGTQQRDAGAVLLRSSESFVARSMLRDNVESGWVDWQTDSSLFMGWENLLEMAGTNGAEPRHVKDQSDWNRFWNAKITGNVFRPDIWPAQPVVDFGQTTPFEFDPRGLTTESTRGGGAITPGCYIEQLIHPDQHQYARALAWVEKPVIPHGLFADDAADELVVNLNENDLGSWLAAQALPARVKIRATGSGRIKSSQIQLSGKSVVIHFEQSGDDALILIPQVPRTGPVLPAFINVADGSLKLRNAMILIENQVERRTVPIPQNLLRVERGSFALEQCIFRGPKEPPKNWKGLLDWVPAPGNPQQAPSSVAVINDSLLIAPGTIARMELSGQLWRSRNTAYIGNGTAAELLMMNSSAASHVDLRLCTMSASENIFTIAKGEAHLSSDPQLRFFSEGCVFLPPPGMPPARLAQLSVLNVPKDLSPNQIDWWEYSNAYAANIQYFRTFDGTRSGTQQDFKTDWEQLWGPSRVQRPLIGPNAASLRGHTRGNITADLLTVDDFNLDMRSKAATWSESGGPIGAHIGFADEDKKPDPKRPTVPQPGTKPKSKFDF